MTWKERQISLLSKGYFPQELPPTFTTYDFGVHSSDIVEAWRSSAVFSTDPAYLKRPGKPKFRVSGSYHYGVQDAEAELISKPKRGYERRHVHITHPVPQALLSREIAINWNDIASWLGRQKYSVDRVNISDLSERSVDGINFPVHRAKKAFIEAASDWLVRTDISRFYPSIYTHSIPWAAYGKDRVKADLRLYAGALADRLDVLVRSCNRNQTVGIPVGPETSRIIAEVISARVDQKFSGLQPKARFDKIDRLQDDWFVGTDTLQAAEQVLTAITSVYRDFGLEINGSKTSIDRMVLSSQNSWTSELSSFLSHASRRPNGSRFQEFLNLGLRLQTAYPSEPVVGYVLSVIEGSKINASEAEPLESFLLKGAVLSPLALDKICRVAINVDRDTGKLSKSRIVERFASLAETNLENGYHYEAIWLVHTIRGLHRTLDSKKLSEMMEAHAGAALPLILLDMKSAGLFARSLPVAHWETKIDESTISSDWTWLLAYEGIRHGWLKDPKKLLATAFFKPMSDRNVVFYDPKRNVPASSNVVRRRRARSKKHATLAFRLLQSLRGLERSREMFEEY